MKKSEAHSSWGCCPALSYGLDKCQIVKICYDLKVIIMFCIICCKQSYRTLVLCCYVNSLAFEENFHCLSFFLQIDISDLQHITTKLGSQLEKLNLMNCTRLSGGHILPLIQVKKWTFIFVWFNLNMYTVCGHNLHLLN